MMNKYVMQIETISHMPKPYGDHLYEAIFTFSGGLRGVWTPLKEKVLAYAEADFGQDFYPMRKGVGPGPYLKSIEQLSANKWKVVIVEPFYD